MYKVIRFFYDLKDGNHAYKVGDTFPREGVKADADRVKELLGDGNRLGTPLVRADKLKRRKKDAD